MQELNVTRYMGGTLIKEEDIKYIHIEDERVKRIMKDILMRLKKEGFQFDFKKN